MQNAVDRWAMEENILDSDNYHILLGIDRHKRDTLMEPRSLDFPICLDILQFYISDNSHFNSNILLDNKRQIRSDCVWTGIPDSGLFWPLGLDIREDSSIVRFEPPEQPLYNREICHVNGLGYGYNADPVGFVSDGINLVMVRDKMAEEDLR